MNKKSTFNKIISDVDKSLNEKFYKLIILFPLKCMGITIVKFVWEYKLSAG